MKQVLVAGIILGAIGLSLVLVPPARLSRQELLEGISAINLVC